VKQRRLAAAGIAVPPNLTFVPIDFARTGLADALAAAGFDRTQPAFFAWLGVVPYLERAAIVETLRFVTGCAPGTSIVFDYGPPPQSLGLLSRIVLWRVQRRLKAIGEPWITFFRPPEVVLLLREVGFRQVENFGRTELNQRYLAGRTDGLRISDATFIAKATV
jgi:methyltransferase (TIGR00027 family)